MLLTVIPAGSGRQYAEWRTAFRRGRGQASGSEQDHPAPAIQAPARQRHRLPPAALLVWLALAGAITAAPALDPRSVAVRPGQRQPVRSFNLRLRGPEELAVAVPPAWWTFRWPLPLLAGVGVGLAGGLVWIALLRRKLAAGAASLRQTNARLQSEIAARRRMEQEMHKALEQEKELSALKSQFISMVSHEIRTPLALILSSSEILRHYVDRLPELKRAQHLENIHQAVHRMSAWIEDVLIFSRAESGRLEFKPAPLDFGVFCRQLVDEIQSATGQRNPIALTLPEPGAAARLDESLVRYILGNLLNNAVKYSPPDAPVSLEVSVVGDHTVFRVRDRGIGIPDADQKRLFTPFYRGSNAAHIPGTGLGLLIVKRCVERHGGRLELASQEGLGTTVTVFLPSLANGHTEFLSKSAPEQA